MKSCLVVYKYPLLVNTISEIVKDKLNNFDNKGVEKSVNPGQ